ncbi:WH2 domain-containing protein [Entamoeba marina]
MTTRKDDFNLKSKEEEKQMISFTDLLQDNLKTVLPNMKKLIGTLEQYSKVEEQLAQQTAATITALDGITQTGMKDFDVGMIVVRDILCELYTGRTNSNNQGTVSLIEGLKAELTNKTKELSNVTKQTLTERRKWDDELTKSQKKMQQHPENLSTYMEEFKKIEKERQQILMSHLQMTVYTNRATFGTCIGCFASFFKNTGDSLKTSADKFIVNEPRLQKLSKSLSNIPHELRALMTNKKQSFVNLSGITPELKQILKSAGLKPSHLANKEIVTQFYKEIQKLVVAGKLPADILDQLKSTGNVDERVITARVPTAKKANSGWVTARVPGKPVPKKQNNASNSSNYPQKSYSQQSSYSNSSPTPPPPRRTQPTSPTTSAPPPPPPSRRNAAPPPPPPPSGSSVPPPPPPPPSRRNAAPPPPPPPSGSSAPPPPPPPRGGSSAPPPPPPPSGSSAPPPPPSTAGPSLLEQIQSGTTLKKASNQPAKEELNDQQKTDLTSLLSNVMASRRKDIADDEYEDDEDESEDWDD